MNRAGYFALGNDERKRNLGSDGGILKRLGARRSKPSVEVVLGFFLSLGESLVESGDVFFELIPFRTIALKRGEDDRRVLGIVPVHGRHGGVAEVGGEGIEILLRNGIELMIMAGRAPGG